MVDGRAEAAGDLKETQKNKGGDGEQKDDRNTPFCFWIELET